MIATAQQRALRASLSTLSYGPRRAAVEMIRQGVAPAEAIIIAQGVWFVLQDIAFAPAQMASSRLH